MPPKQNPGRRERMLPAVSPLTSPVTTYKELDAIAREIVRAFYKQTLINEAEIRKGIPVGNEEVGTLPQAVGTDMVAGRKGLAEHFGLSDQDLETIVVGGFHILRARAALHLEEMISEYVNPQKRKQRIVNYRKDVQHYLRWREGALGDPLIRGLNPEAFTFENISRLIDLDRRKRLPLQLDDDHDVREGQIFLQYSIPQLMRAVEEAAEFEPTQGKNIYEKIADDIDLLKDAAKGKNKLLFIYLAAMRELDTVDTPLECFLVGTSNAGGVLPCSLASEKVVEEIYQKSLYLRDAILEAVEFNCGEFVGNLLLQAKNKSPERVREVLDLLREAIALPGVHSRLMEAWFKDEGASSLVYFLRYANERPETFKLCKELRRHGVEPSALIGFIKNNHDHRFLYKGEELSVEEYVFDKCHKPFQKITLAAIIGRGGIIFTEEAFEEDRESLIEVALEVPQGDEIIQKYTALTEGGCPFKAKLLLAAAIESGREPLSAANFHSSFDFLSEDDCEDFLSRVGPNGRSLVKKLLAFVVKMQRENEEASSTPQVTTAAKKDRSWFGRMMMDAVGGKEGLPEVQILRLVRTGFGEDTRKTEVFRSVWRHRRPALEAFCEDALAFTGRLAYDLLIASPDHCRRYVDALGEGGELLDQIREVLQGECPSNPHAAWNELLLIRPEDSLKSLCVDSGERHVPDHLFNVRPYKFSRMVVFTRDFSNEAIAKITAIGAEQGVPIVVKPLGVSDKKVASLGGLAEDDLVVICGSKIGHTLDGMVRKAVHANGEIVRFKRAGHELLCEFLGALIDCRKK